MKNYIKPEIKTENIVAEDVIMTSLPDSINGKSGEDYGSATYNSLFGNE